MPTAAKAQTTKQAKAAYKARGRPALTEKEQRQLARSIELDLRAQRARDLEKRRADAAKKKAKVDGRDEAEAARQRLGSQRRHDRYGFKASQFHLGAFFGTVGPERRGEAVTEDGTGKDEDMFGDDDLNDEMLLQVLEHPGRPAAQPLRLPARDRAPEAAIVPQLPSLPVVPKPQPAEIAHASVNQDDMNRLWNELDSSTQVARELDTTKRTRTDSTAVRNSSFSSSDFDLTAEDMEELDPPKQQAPTQAGSHDEVLMPPPAAPEKRHLLEPVESLQAAARPTSSLVTAPRRHKPLISPPRPPLQAVHHSMPAPSAFRQPVLRPMKPAYGPLGTSAQSLATSRSAQRPPVRQRQHQAAARQRSRGNRTSEPAQTKPPNAIRGPFLPASSLYCSPELGFTLSQLENCIDDDIQLTQAVPG